MLSSGFLTICKLKVVHVNEETRVCAVLFQLVTLFSGCVASRHGRCIFRLDFRVWSTLPVRGRSAGSFPEQRLVIEPTAYICAKPHFDEYLKFGIRFRLKTWRSLFKISSSSFHSSNGFLFIVLHWATVKTI